MSSDRYGGRAPSWLLACHGQCEAMGTIPFFQTIASDGQALDPLNDSEPWLVAAWNAEHAAHEEGLCDGWHFVRCPECRGTGRASLGVVATRLPSWLWMRLRRVATSWREAL